HLDEVVTGLRLHLRGVLRLLWAHVRDVVDLELDAGVLGEALADLRQLLVRVRCEVVTAEITDLTGLGDRRRGARGENARQPGGAADDELPSREPSHGTSSRPQAGRLLPSRGDCEDRTGATTCQGNGLLRRVPIA